MTMENLVCLSARGAFLRSSSLLRFLSLRTDECTGNGGPGLLKEYSVTTGRLGLGLVGLEGEALGSDALLALDRKNQLFLGLGRRRVQAETAHRTFNCLDCGDGCNYLVDGSCSQRRHQEKPCRTSKNLLSEACKCSCTISGRFSFEEKPTERCLCQRGGIPIGRNMSGLKNILVT